MSITLYRKYRPQNFSEIAGQEFVTRAIKNSLREGRLSHAYLFTGPRGVGKTTLARLIAKGVNCLSSDGITDSPCGTCDNCIEISKGISMDMVEIDAASNRGIDEIRELKEKINYQPVRGRKKIYIIDEVHMLTKEAFNALLKTLEEPPAHVIFILATTEIEKIPDTVVSRCQRYDFLPIEKKHIIALLRSVAEKEKIDIDNESLALIYRKSEGSARDSFSIFEQVISNFNGENIDISKTQKALGVVPDIILERFLNLLQSDDKVQMLDFIDEMWEEGIVIETFLKDFAYYLKEKFKKESSLPVDFILETVSGIFSVLNDFKYEEDKRLLGYVLIHELKSKRHPYGQIYSGSHDIRDNMPKASENARSIKNTSNVTPAQENGLLSGRQTSKEQISGQLPSEKAGKSTAEITKEYPSGSEPAEEGYHDRNEGKLENGSPGKGKKYEIGFFESNWERILTGIKTRSVMLHALTEHLRPLRVERDTLIVSMPSEYVFHKNKLMEAANRNAIQEVINAVCNSDIEFKAVLGDGENEEGEGNNFINKIIDFFEADIIEMK